MDERDEFVNRTQGWVGYIRINRKGDEVAESLEPGDRVFLTAEEQLLTARSHRRAEDSPFETRSIVHFDQRTGEIIDQFDAPLLEKIEPTPKPEPEPTQKPARRKPATAVTA